MDEINSNALQVYYYFGGDNDNRKNRKRFINGEDSHITLNYPRLKKSVIENLIDSLDKQLIKAKNKYGSASAQTQSIEYKLQEARFLEAAYMVNYTNDESFYDVFMKLNEELYAAPKKYVAEKTLIKIKNSINEALLQGESERNDLLRQLWQEIESGFHVTLKNGDNITVPQLNYNKDGLNEEIKLASNVQSVLKKQWLEFGKASRSVIDAIITDKEHFSVDDICEVFTHAISELGEQYGFDANQVKVIKDKSTASICWDVPSKTIRIGAHRPKRLLVRKKLYAVVNHELMHLVKTMLALRYAPDKPSLAYGTYTKKPDQGWVRYLDFEEANNKLGEMVTYGREGGAVSASDLYDLIGSLAYGQLSNVNSGFNERQAYELIRKVCMIILLLENKVDIDNVERIANKRAFALIVRMYRGTPFKKRALSDGRALIYTKDLAYGFNSGMSRAIAYWNTFANLDGSEANEAIERSFEKLKYGKIDPLESSHLVLLENH